jgi:hypothetical protein
MSETEKNTATSNDLKNLLAATKRIVKHHHEMTIAKGEHFNLFSVLNIETKENKTHSAFLTELLNPKGSHRKGALFLDLFLQVVKLEVLDEKVNKEKFPAKEFITDKVYVKAEHSVGAINLCDKKGEDKANASGGRIDIFLKDKNGTVICIENKIHADDQPKQIQRYCNYKTTKNTVFYLTLKGSEPSDDSKLKLISGKDFFNISYRDHIVQWLELCLKEIPNFTSLREAINQYILLIKKLTHILNLEQEEELTDLIIDNLEAGKYFANNYYSILDKIREQFRIALKEQVQLKLGTSDYKVSLGERINKQYAQLWIDYKDHNEKQFRFGVESFSGQDIIHGNMFVGIIDKMGVESKLKPLENYSELSDWWPHYEYLKTAKEATFNLSEENILKIIKEPESEKFKNFVMLVADQIEEFINVNGPRIFKYKI